MTVKEFIKILKEMPQDAEIYVNTWIYLEKEGVIYDEESHTVEIGKSIKK